MNQTKLGNMSPLDLPSDLVDNVSIGGIDEDDSFDDGDSVQDYYAARLSDVTVSSTSFTPLKKRQRDVPQTSSVSVVSSVNQALVVDEYDDDDIIYDDSESQPSFSGSYHAPTTSHEADSDLKRLRPDIEFVCEIPAKQRSVTPTARDCIVQCSFGDQLACTQASLKKSKSPWYCTACSHELPYSEVKIGREAHISQSHRKRKPRDRDLTTAHLLAKYFPCGCYCQVCDSIIDKGRYTHVKLHPALYICSEDSCSFVTACPSEHCSHLSIQHSLSTPSTALQPQTDMDERLEACFGSDRRPLACGIVQFSPVKMAHRDRICQLCVESAKTDEDIARAHRIIADRWRHIYCEHMDGERMVMCSYDGCLFGDCFDLAPVRKHLETAHRPYGCLLRIIDRRSNLETVEHAKELIEECFHKIDTSSRVNE